MKVLNDIHKLIFDLIELKKKYRNLYFEQLKINKKLREKIKYLKNN